MLEFIVLMLVLVTMALTGFYRAGHAAGERVFVLFGALAGMFALIIKLAPWLLLVLAVCWICSATGASSRTPTVKPPCYRILPWPLLCGPFAGRLVQGRIDGGVSALSQGRLQSPESGSSTRRSFECLALLFEAILRRAAPRPVRPPGARPGSAAPLPRSARALPLWCWRSRRSGSVLIPA